MSEIGHAIGGLFGGDDDKPDTSAQEALARQQAELERQQKAQIEQQRRQLEKERIAALKGRFSAGGGGVGATEATDNPANSDVAAASLFSRITGRTD